MERTRVTVASVRFRSPDGAFTYVTGMGLEQENAGKWAHGWVHRYGRPIKEVHAEALVAAVKDAKEKHGLDVEITNADAALVAAKRAVEAAEAYDLRMAEAGALQPIGHGKA